MSNEIMINKKMKSRLIIIGVCVGIIFFIISGIFLKGYFSAKEKADQKIAELEAEIERLLDEPAVVINPTKEISIEYVEAQITDIGELATIEYMYTNAGKYSDMKQFLGLDIGFTEKSFIAKWDGIIKAGIEMEMVTVNVNNKNKEIVIGLPDAKILSHELDDTSFETLDEKDGVFNKLQIDDIRKFDTKTKEAMEKKAIENGILEKAYENAKNIIYKLVYTDVVEEQGYIVKFETIIE